MVIEQNNNNNLTKYYITNIFMSKYECMCGVCVLAYILLLFLLQEEKYKKKIIIIIIIMDG